MEHKPPKDNTSVLNNIEEIVKKKAHKRRYQKGEAIFSMGEKGDCAYIVETGRIEVFITTNTEKVVLTTLGVGEIFGEMSVVDGSPRSASAVAIEDSELVLVSREALSERFEAADPVVRLLITILLKHLRSSNHAQLNEGLAMGSSGDTFDSVVLSNQKAAVVERLRLESDLKQALEYNEFRIHFQPIMNMQTAEIAGFEALIRWQSPSRGIVRPDLFMGIAEETSLIVPIGKWVIEEVCAQFAKMKRIMNSHGIFIPAFMSVNISGRQLYDEYFLSHLTDSLKKYEVSPQDIKLEVTERIFMEGAKAQYVLQQARQLGFRIAIDDFGTGYSSLSFLSQFEIDNLKVDQSFVRVMNKDAKMMEITKAIVSMSIGLGLTSIAEGIETEDDYETLKDMGCDFGQGYFFAKPMPFDKAFDFLLKKQKHQGEAV